MLSNLAGLPNPDPIVERELARCRIDAIRGETSRGEVATSITGRLGPNFTFRRAWRYWVVEGRVPLWIAEELYADPVGRDDVRAGGDACCRHPSTWTTWYDEVDGDDVATGKRLAPMTERSKFEMFAEKIPSMRKAMGDYVFVEDPPSYGVGYVTAYHIDSEIGLRLFADTLRKHGLADVARDTEGTYSS